MGDESGQGEVYVVPFAGPGGKWQVSAGGGAFPRWRGDGRELFYLSLDGSMMSRFLLNTAASSSVPVTVVSDWTAALKK